MTQAMLVRSQLLKVKRVDAALLTAPMMDMISRLDPTDMKFVVGPMSLRLART